MPFTVCLTSSIILRKSHSETERRKMLRKLCCVLKVTGASHEKLCDAIDTDEFSDFEDCLQDKCAQEVSADYIVSRNTEDFRNYRIAGKYCAGGVIPRPLIIISMAISVAAGIPVSVVSVIALMHVDLPVDLIHRHAAAVFRRDVAIILGEREIGGVLADGQAAVVRFRDGTHIRRIAFAVMSLAAGAAFDVGQNRVLLFAVVRGYGKGQREVFRQIGLHSRTVYNGVNGVCVEPTVDPDILQDSLAFLVVSSSGYHAVISVQSQLDRWIYINADVGNWLAHGITANAKKQCEYSTCGGKCTSPHGADGTGAAPFALRTQKTHGGRF